MHLTIYLDILNYVEAISFQTAVEVVQIVYAAYFACSSIEEFGRDGLAQRISFFTVLLVVIIPLILLGSGLFIWIKRRKN